MNQVYLEIEDLETLVAFVRDVRQRTGLLKDILPSKVRGSLNEIEFPVRIPIDLDAVIALADNPILKKTFGKKIENGARTILEKAMET